MSKQNTIRFHDECYDGQFIRTFSSTLAETSDIGEAFATSHAIPEVSSSFLFTILHPELVSG
ncbi:MAG: hypothetical protein QM753_03470 [Thermomicrobiales bacterium]